ncbi:MAG TPA: hypothetical protein VGG54_31935, partial [Trebonia sp.]
MAADLPAVVAACDPQAPAGLRDRAVILLGFALLARRAELAALSISDVEHVPGEGLAVTIRASKTDQSARGLVRRIHYASAEAVCPVRAVLAWLAYLAARGRTAGPLFTRIDRWGNLGAGAGGRYPAAARAVGPGSASRTRSEAATLTRATTVRRARAGNRTARRRQPAGTAGQDGTGGCARRRSVTSSRRRALPPG